MNGIVERFENELKRLDYEIERTGERVEEIQEEMNELNIKAMNLEQEIIWYTAQKQAITDYLKTVKIEKED